MYGCIKLNIPKMIVAAVHQRGGIAVVPCIFSGSGFMPSLLKMVP